MLAINTEENYSKIKQELLKGKFYEPDNPVLMDWNLKLLYKTSARVLLRTENNEIHCVIHMQIEMNLNLTVDR